MEIITLCLLLFFILLTSIRFLKSSSFSSSRRSMNLPPGPKPYPIIGNIPQIMSKDFHLSLRRLSKTYGPIMSLYLGNKLAIVVSSPEIAKEIVKAHDHVFTNRPSPVVTHVHDRNKYSMSFRPVSDEWRKLRRICKEHMFSTQRLEASKDLRQEMMKNLCDYIDECCVDGRAIDVGEVAFITTLNLVSVTLFSTVLADYGSEDEREFRESIEGIFNMIATPNIVDLFPILEPFDPQGLKKQAELHVGKLLPFFEGLVNRRMETRRRANASERENDMLEELFDIMERDGELTYEEIKHLLMDLFIGGTHSTSSAVHWIMSELLRNPNVMLRVQDELRTLVGKNEQVQESDISKLRYFKAVFKETLRYHPTGAVLFPRIPDQDIEIKGYVIPKGSDILLNIFALSNDPNTWANPDVFDPERFMGTKNIDFKGQYFELLPFGCGRRICPGLSFADRMMHLMAATLVHRFDWKLEPSVKPEDLDKHEKSKFLLRKSVPLVVIPVKP